MNKEIPKVWTGKESLAKIGNIDFPADDNAEYKLVWNDEFDKDSLDLTKWSGNTQGCPNADYAYTSDLEHWRFKNSVATLSMTKFDKPDLNGKLYLDGYSFVTHDKMNFQYGYLEMRAKIPFFGKGEFPAFWLVSGHSSVARNAADFKKRDCEVEIDIFENFSSKNQVVPNLHKYENTEIRRHVQLSGIDQGASVNGTRTFSFESMEEARKWHTYGFLWTKDIMSFSVDGEFYYSYNLNKNFGDFGSMAGFHQPLGIIISNQIFSAGWCEVSEWAASLGPPPDEIFPLEYKVDYVRLYQKEGSMIFINNNPDLSKLII